MVWKQEITGKRPKALGGSGSVFHNRVTLWILSNTINNKCKQRRTIKSIHFALKSVKTWYIQSMGFYKKSWRNPRGKNHWQISDCDKQHYKITNWNAEPNTFNQQLGERSGKKRSFYNGWTYFTVCFVQNVQNQFSKGDNGKVSCDLWPTQNAQQGLFCQRTVRKIDLSKKLLESFCHGVTDGDITRGILTRDEKSS